ncbi:hypothetical protein KFL_000450150 [Klebsormidium nitens]|uniref:Uncharacterized protein n=1 Tax=Klebsormidium nitens TaxID=105231 RepID=A0A1Y1HSA1_KLENI|nr:hypothetical protein KFL_000450150 [Klebsormidium nitens]|eukprot:GAQ80059.1 hypothetical protein KFL_000450150 [Klebsormidium nitens]
MTAAGDVTAVLVLVERHHQCLEIQGTAFFAEKSLASVEDASDQPVTRKGCHSRTARRTTAIKASPESSSTQPESPSAAPANDEGEEGISDAEVQASIAAAAGLLGAPDSSAPWSLKDEVEGMTDEPVYVLRKEKAKSKTPKEVIFELLFLLGGMLDRPFEDGGSSMEASAEVVIERIQEEMNKARDQGETNEKLTELGRYVNLLAMDMKLVGAARKYDTLLARCKVAQDKVKSAMQRAEALDA